MKKSIILTMGAVVLSLSLITGCGTKMGGNETGNENNAPVAVYDATAITVEAVANEVTIKTITGDKIEVTGPEDLSVAHDGNTLTIQAPEPEAGVSIKPPKPIAILVPETFLETITVHTEVGRVFIENVNTASLVVTSEAGDIQLRGLEGKIQAASTIGKIDTRFDAEIKDAGINGSQLEYQLGDSANVISLTTEVGNITIE